MKKPQFIFRRKDMDRSLFRSKMGKEIPIKFIVIRTAILSTPQCKQNHSSA